MTKTKLAVQPVLIHLGYELRSEFSNPADALALIESMKLVGIHRNNWSNRTIKLFEDATDPAFVYAVGYRAG